MGEALLSRIVGQGVYLPAEVLVSEPQPQRREQLASQYNVAVTADNKATFEATEVLLLAVKPQVFDLVAKDLAQDGEAESEKASPSQVVVSIMAGVPLSKLEKAFPGKAVVRAMPNTPATVGAGITAIAPGSLVKPDQRDRAKTILEAVGEVVEVPEYLLDAVTGLSGSGPGYVAIVIEALSDGGVRAGLPRAIASQLALQTVLGTAKLLQETNLHPAQLKDRVTSPGGTTIAGIASLESAGLRSALIEAVRASAQRSKELGS